ncbi:MAG TPA: efflux RND transporter periplasmic adaptor subunit [Phycisphaerales bacterium]|nr:efflux RND transporter periplasmic adaptor subunit [Phycisphaerales bacterium]
MTRTRVAFLVSIPIAAAVPLVLAHEGHAPPSVAAFDMNAPRTVSPETATLIGLETAEADFGPIEAVMPLLGIVKTMPDRQETLVAKLPGIVATARVQTGDIVKKGDVLAELNSIELMRDLMELDELQMDFDRITSEMNQADTRIVDTQLMARTAAEQAVLAEEELQRLQQNPEAIPANVISAKQSEAMHARTEQRRREIDLSLARRLFTSLEAQADSKRRAMASLRAVITFAGHEWINPDDPKAMAHQPYLTIRAGMDGVVMSRLVNPGQGVESGVPLFQIADFSTVQIEGELPESLAARFGAATGQPVRIRTRSDGKPVSTGIVKFISPTIDPVKRTAHLIIETENPGGVLRPGMYAELSVVLRAEPEAVVVPVEAVLRDGPARFVFMKDGETYVRRDVVTGAADDRVIEIKEGVVPGDVVATRGSYHLIMLRPSADDAHDHDHDGHDHDHDHYHSDHDHSH